MACWMDCSHTNKFSWWALSLQYVSSSSRFQSNSGTEQTPRFCFLGLDALQHVPKDIDSGTPKKIATVICHMFLYMLKTHLGFYFHFSLLFGDCLSWTMTIGETVPGRCRRMLSANSRVAQCCRFIAGWVICWVVCRLWRDRCIAVNHPIPRTHRNIFQQYWIYIYILYMDYHLGTGNSGQTTWDHAMCLEKIVRWIFMSSHPIPSNVCLKYMVYPQCLAGKNGSFNPLELGGSYFQTKPPEK